jgi:hypothetical protein
MAKEKKFGDRIEQIIKVLANSRFDPLSFASLVSRVASFPDNARDS